MASIFIGVLVLAHKSSSESCLFPTALIYTVKHAGVIAHAAREAAAL